jgi:hypothetical protein
LVMSQFVIPSGAEGFLYIINDKILRLTPLAQDDIPAKDRPERHTNGLLHW